MKISIHEIDTEQFFVNPHKLAGENVFLVHPKHIGAKWNKKNLVFRSSIWNSEGELISASFKKFFNWGEQPELAYTPFSMTANGGVQLMEKIDGSTLIVSKYKGELIVRTRGTVDATRMDKNGDEVAFLKEKYPAAFQFTSDTSEFSFIFEWVSPKNKIVINYNEPDLYLIAVVNHKDYSYQSQKDVDEYAQLIGVKRPRKFDFNTFDSMFEAIHALDYAETRKLQSPKEIISDLKNKTATNLSREFEGFCVYCNHGQDIRKVKSAWYLALHKLKSEVSSIDKVIDLWFTLECPTYVDFYKYLHDHFDYEIAESCRGYSSKICQAKAEVDAIITGMQQFIEKDVKPMPTRKLQAVVVTQAYGKTNRASFLFKLLDGKQLARDDRKKLLYQVLK